MQLFHGVPGMVIISVPPFYEQTNMYTDISNNTIGTKIYETKYTRKTVGHICSHG